MTWKEYTLGDLCLKVTDGSHFSPKEVSEGYPMFSVKDMVENGFDYTSVKLISQADFLKLSKGDCKPKKGDVLIAKDGSYLKHVFICKEEREEAILSSIAILRPNKKIILSEFLQYILRVPSVKGMMESFVSGSALPRIVLKDFKKMKLSIPYISTQKSIISVLSAYDELIEVNNQRIQVLEETARQLYKEWFVRMRFPGYKKTKFEKGIPEGWELSYFRNFIKLNRGFDLPDEKIVEGEYPIVASTSVKGYHNNYKVEAPCVATGRSGSLGTVQYINQKSWPLNTSLYVKDFKGNSPRYVYYFLQNLNLETYNAGAGVPSLNQNHLHGLKFPLPPKEIQKKFDTIIVPIFSQIENLQQQNTQLRQIRNRLLPRLISGKLQVKAATEELICP